MFKKKHIFALKIEICALLSISRTFMKIDVILMPQFFSRMQVACRFCMEWTVTPLMQRLVSILPASIENVGKKKKTCAID